MLSCDINCDIGEGFGSDGMIYPLISSANIACGYHAGDDTSMMEAVALATKFNVAIGAHPSFPDRSGFGRKVMSLSESDLYHVVRLQVLALRHIAAMQNTVLAHVKPHGALYNLAMTDKVTARIIVEAVKDIDDSLLIFGQHNKCLLSEARKAGLHTVAEVFADRNMEDDGSLSSRSEAGALLTDPHVVATRVADIVRGSGTTSRSGKLLHVCAETICVHSDTPGAVESLKQIRAKLNIEGIQVAKPSKH